MKDDANIKEVINWQIEEKNTAKKNRLHRWTLFPFLPLTHCCRHCSVARCQNGTIAEQNHGLGELKELIKARENFAHKKASVTSPFSKRWQKTLNAIRLELHNFHFLRHVRHSNRAIESITCKTDNHSPEVSRWWRKSIVQGARTM